MSECTATHYPTEFDNRDKIMKRIKRLKELHAVNLVLAHPYNQLPEKAKIPLRIEQAEIDALEDLFAGRDLQKSLEWCVAGEHYCGAEGVKRAMEFQKTLQK